MGCTSSRSPSESSFEDVTDKSTRSSLPESHSNGVARSVSPKGGGVSAKGKKTFTRDNGTVSTRTSKLQAEDVPNMSNPAATHEEIISSLEADQLYCDRSFDAINSSLYYSCTTESLVQWQRPKDLLPNGEIPEMMVDGVTKDDIQQGILGDCWFLSSCAAVSQQERFMKKIMPDKKQPLSGPGYTGLVWFRFWRFGEWVEVCIDDRLPVEDGKLMYAHCTEAREFWVALIEKAYAKLHGSYEALEGGQTMDALVDLTGGLAERYELQDYNPSMFPLLMRAHKSGAFIACSRKGDWKTGHTADANGLVSGHAYTVTGITKIQHGRGEEKLVRMRNPWGDSTEWRGSWSDNDANWEWVSKDTKQLMGMESRDDGEFWMSFRDFCCHFQEVTICLTGPDFDGDGVCDSAGHFMRLHGAWTEGLNAGGSRNDLRMFSTNPQYMLTLTQPDDFNPLTDDADNEGKCSVVVALMQESKIVKNSVKDKCLQIGFMLYKTNTPSVRLPAKHFRYYPDCGKSGVYINYREVSGRFELDPGHYVIIPSTFLANCSAAFMLRVYGEKPFSLQCLEDRFVEES